MKPINLLKIPMLIVGIGAALALTPACKAQSEVGPDHFDGTDSWQTSLAQEARAQKQQVKTAPPRQTQASTAPTVKLASNRQVVKSAGQDAVAIQDKRKVASRKSNNR